jgi:hypothetical protein
VSIAVGSACAGDVDPRFDGRWIGIEKYKYGWLHYIYWVQSTTVIGIADSGKMVGVLSGFATGRYEVSPDSSGRTLIFKQPDIDGGKHVYIGRKRCKLFLSSDGNTLREQGYAIWRSGSSAEVWATFHRQGK